MLVSGQTLFCFVKRYEVSSFFRVQMSPGFRLPEIRVERPKQFFSFDNNDNKNDTSTTSGPTSMRA